MNGNGTPPTVVTDGSVASTGVSSNNLSTYYLNSLITGIPPTGATVTGRNKDAGSKPLAYFKPTEAIAQPLEETKRESGPTSGGATGAGGRGPSSSTTETLKEEDRKGNAPEKPHQQLQEQATPRKIVIRSGEVEFEVESFDAAVATINRLVKPLAGAFIATVNSDKLANGKVRGTVVVRVPPEHLDSLLLDLRTNMGKTAELKNQRIGSQDITKQYTDLESRLKAARAMEERLLQIIKSGKGEIKDLLAVEKELGTWRTRVEEIEGELRYYANLVALSTLTITLFEKEIQAPYGIVERERVQMGIEVDDVDQAMQAAQQAVREAKGRITKAELKQHSAGQFSATLHFEVAPDAAGPLRDRFKQLGTVARLDVDRLEETEGGTGKPQDGKTKRSDTRFQVAFYNLTNVAPRETVNVNLACVDTEVVFKSLLVRVEKASGRVLSSSLNSGKSDQAQAELQFEVKAAAADTLLEDVKSAGEVIRVQVTENPDAANTTRKKRGFHVQLRAVEMVAARETDTLQVATRDVAAGYLTLQEAIVKARGRILNAQLNEQDRQNITAVLDFELRRSDEAAFRGALATVGDIYTRTVVRAPDSDNVIDSKVLWKLTLMNATQIPPRETHLFGIEVADVDQAAAMIAALVAESQGRTVNANLARERSGRVTAKLVYDVPLAKVHELIARLKASGTVRVQNESKQPDVPDSPLAIGRLDITLSNVELIVPSDEGFWPRIRGGFSTSIVALSWSLMVVIVGVCFVLPWALLIYAAYRVVVRLRGRTGPATPAT
jgi:hypothetical protein